MIDKVAILAFALLGGAAAGHALASMEGTAALVAVLCGLLCGLSIASMRGAR